jgi:hypothetical protein
MTPRVQARTAGFFWLMTFVTGIVALLTGGRLVVERDAAVTASNILANESLFLLGGAANLVATLCYVAVTLFLYQLFKPVNENLARLGVFFSLVGCAIGGFSGFFDFAPLLLLKNSPYLSVFSVDQLEALSLLFLQLRVKAGNIGLVFFAFHCLLTGVLILKSTFVPRPVGALMVLAGLGWMTFVWPPLAASLMPYNLLPGMLGEGSLTLWLLVMGVNVEKWRDQAGTTNLQTAVV